MIIGVYAEADSVGIYGVVERLVTIIVFALGAFSTIIPSIISSLHTSGDMDELRRVVRESTRWILTIAIPIVLVFVIEGKLILNHLYGEEYIGGYVALVILSLGQLINAGSGLVGYMLQMTGGHMIFMKITIFWGIVNIILNFILVPYFGIIGAALSTGFSLSMVNIVSVFVVYKKLDVFTIAKGLKFDILFILVVAAVYSILNYSDYLMGNHILLALALIVYGAKSIICKDMPVSLILERYRA
jgi:O-antigen/teichoic acid export membrane protein